MDINGLRSFGLSHETGGLQPWRVPQADGAPAADVAVGVEPTLHHRITGTRLASRAQPGTLQETATRVDDVLLQPAMAVDALGNHVHWDGTQIVSTSHLAAQHGLAPRAFALPPEAQPVSDMTVGDDDVLYLAANGALWLVDLRGRFELTRLAAPAGFQLHRLASAPGGGVWALDVDQGRLVRLHGLPQAQAPLWVGREHDARFEARQPNPDPPRWQPLATQLPPDEKAVALASHRHGPLVVLSLLRSAAGGARVRLLLDDGRLSLPLALEGPRFPHTLGFVEAGRLAVATRGTLSAADGQARDPGVFTYALPPSTQERLAAASAPGQTALPPDMATSLPPLGDYFPLTGWTGGPFLNGRPGDRLHYPRSGPQGVLPARVARVSTASRARYGLVVNAADGRTPQARVLASLGLVDTRDPATVWHRLYAEAVVPPGCALLVWLATSEAGVPAFASGDPEQRAHWYPHLLGERSALPPAVQAALPDDLPRAAWVKEPTELPQGQGVLGCAPVPGRSGLFTVLIQRAHTAVRALQGPRLWVAVELFGDGRASPELVALRAYAGRVSYRDRYLPALYHEQVFGEDAERAGAATGADFLDRFLHLFEGLFTDIEARVAAAALMTDARSCPPEALPWLASWVGLSLHSGLPTERARWMLANAAALARRHGTLAGLQRALDIATDGAVTQGRIVVVEDFRLRRTLSTILGAQLQDLLDPLTSGITQSGNSVVGDALFLGDAATLQDDQLQTFLALFRRLGTDRSSDQALLDRQSAAARRALFDDLAHRVTVLVHETADADEFGLIQRLSQLGAPAHVGVSVVRAAYPFMVGVASLIGADSFLRAAPPQRPVRVGPGDETSALGGVDTLRGEASLDAHAGAFDGVLPPAAAPVAPPVARAQWHGSTPATPDAPDGSVATSGPTTPFQLDGSASTADAGHEITAYTWTHLPPT